MRGRLRGRLLAALLVGLAVAALLVSLLRPARGPQPRSSGSGGETSGSASSAARIQYTADDTQRPSLPAAGPVRIPAPGGGAEAQAVPPPDPEAVRAALARFRRELGKISRDQIAAEQERMTEFLERARAIEAPEPRVEPFRDEHGLMWNKLIYPSGEVRYEFPSEAQRIE